MTNKEWNELIGIIKSIVIATIAIQGDEGMNFAKHLLAELGELEKKEQK